MSVTKLFIHAAWSTVHHKNQITPSIESKICPHIIEYAKTRSIQITDIKVLPDHIHVLIKIHATQNLSQIIHTIKGESSNWINSLKLTQIPFVWQEGYIAETVSPSDKKMVKNYFAMNGLRHQNMTFHEEARLFKMNKLQQVLLRTMY